MSQPLPYSEEELLTNTVYAMQVKDPAALPNLKEIVRLINEGQNAIVNFKNGTSRTVGEEFIVIGGTKGSAPQASPLSTGYILKHMPNQGLFENEIESVQPGGAMTFANYFKLQAQVSAGGDQIVSPPANEAGRPTVTFVADTYEV